MKTPPTLLAVLALAFAAGCEKHGEHAHHEQHKIVTTSPQAKTVTTTQQYVCQIRSKRHIHVRALQAGYLEAITVKEGQTVKQGDVLFKVVPTLYQARLDAEQAETRLAQVELTQAEQLANRPQPIVSQVEVQLARAKLDKASAKQKLSEAELAFTSVRAPFDGIIDRLEEMQGSLVKEGDSLTTLSDNSTVWVYFNVPEARYLEYKGRQGSTPNPSQLKLVDSRVELALADGSTFKQSAGDTVTVEGQFNNETGNIAFRADFPNPDALLRHGQTGNILIHQSVRDAVVIPQRATFEVLSKRYVFVVDHDEVVHRKEVTIEHELEDVFVVKKGGIGPHDRIVLEGVRQVNDGQKVEADFLKAEDALRDQKFHAE